MRDGNKDSLISGFGNGNGGGRWLCFSILQFLILTLLATIHSVSPWLHHFFLPVTHYNYFNFFFFIISSEAHISFLIVGFITHFFFFFFFFFFFQPLLHYYYYNFFLSFLGQLINFDLIINILLDLVELFLMDSISIMYTEGFYKLGLCPNFKIYHFHHFKFSTNITIKQGKFCRKFENLKVMKFEIRGFTSKHTVIVYHLLIC